MNILTCDTHTVCLSVRLSVKSNNIRTEGLLSLAQALRSNTTLTHIYIWGNLLEEPVCQVTHTRRLSMCCYLAEPQQLHAPPCCSPQAFRELISSGRLLPEHTDVSAYQVDGRVFLAEVFQNVRRHYDSTETGSTFAEISEKQQLDSLPLC